MPECVVDGWHNEGMWQCWRDRVYFTGAIATKHHYLGLKILHREAKRV
jgi:hypothetical protein